MNIYKCAILDAITRRSAAFGPEWTKTDVNADQISGGVNTPWQESTPPDFMLLQVIAKITWSVEQRPTGLHPRELGFHILTEQKPPAALFYRLREKRHKMLYQWQRLASALAAWLEEWHCTELPMGLKWINSGRNELQHHQPKIKPISISPVVYLK